MTGRRRGGAARVAAVLAAGSLLAGAGGLLAACGGGGGTITAYAVFSDVSDLSTGAPVQMADITIGHVTSISLDGIDARVGMTIDQSAQVPSDVSAQVERTTILGERVIELVVPAQAGGGLTAGGGLLADGSTIHHSKVIPDLEQLVKGGAEVFAPISATDLAAMVDAGGQGFGGQAANVHRLLDDLNAVAAGYAGQSATIRTLLVSLDQLGAATAPDAQANAAAVSNLARTTQVLAAQSGRFSDLLTALDRLSVQGRSILEHYLSQIGIQLSGVAAATHAVAVEQADLAKLLVYLKGHNVVVHDVTLQRFVQVLDDVIVCGVPNGGSDNTPTGTCNPGGSGG